MARYIDRNKFLKKCAEAWGYAGVTIKAIEQIADECTTADVAPKSEVDRLKAVMKEMDEQQAYTINMLGESLEKAKSEVERLQEELTKAEADVRNYMKVAEYQQSLSVKRYHEIKRLKEDIERLEKTLDEYEETSGLKQVKAEVAREIFEEIEKIIQDRKNEELKRQGDNKMISPFTYSFGVLETIEFQISELKKKYTEGESNG